MPHLSWNEVRDRAIRFSREHAGDRSESAEKQTFWNDFFNVFGLRRASLASFEANVVNLKGNKGAIDLLWRGKLLVEHKSFGEDLGLAQTQAFTYIEDLTRANRWEEIPRFVLVSDFAHFVLYDLEPEDSRPRLSGPAGVPPADPRPDRPGGPSAMTGGTPVFPRGVAPHHFTLADFPKHIRHFAFMLGQTRVRLDPEDPANEKAYLRMCELHDALKKGGFTGHDLERLLVRILFCLFAEDTAIFAPDTFTQFIRTQTREDGSDCGARLNELCDWLNDPRADGTLSDTDPFYGFRYVNGGLFAERLGFPRFNRDMRKALLDCCDFQWARISPAVFGSLFLDDLRAEWTRLCADRSTRRRAGIEAFQEKLRSLRFLDPACGCGNFLVLAYRELRALEIEVIRELHGTQQQELNVRDLCKVDVDQFHGIEYSEWPVRIAEVALWLMDHQMNALAAEAFGQGFDRLPLKTSPHIVHANALRVDWNTVLPRAQCSYILGNPPFIGHTFQSAEQKADMEQVWGAVKGAGVLDYVTCWYRRAAEYITTGNPKPHGLATETGSAGAPPAVFGAPAENTGRGKAFIATHASRGSDVSGEAPETGGGGARAPQSTPSAFPAPADATRIASPRVAFVSTNSISQGEQVGILWGDLFQRFHLKIHFAHRTFAWASEARGKAHVHVVIIGFGAGDVTGKRIFDYEADASAPTEIPASNISPYLVAGPDTALRNLSTPLGDVPKMSWGNKPTDGGHFLLSPQERQEMIAAEPEAAQFIRRYMGGEDFLNNQERYCLWLKDAAPGVLRRLPRVMARVEAVRTSRLASRAPTTRDYAQHPTLFRQIAQPDVDYLAVPEVSSENRRFIPIAYVSKDVICANTVQFVPGATHFHFGVLTSTMHMAWMRAVCGRLKSDYRYSNTIVYNNFPWPTPTPEQRAKVETAARAVLAAREPHLPPRGMSTLADLYDPLTMPAALAKAHAELDRAVERCYRAEPFRSDRERVEHLFALYEKLTMLFLTPKTKARARKPVPLYRQKRKELPTGQATPESEAAAAHFHTPMGKEDSPPYRAGGRTAGLPDASAE